MLLQAASGALGGILGGIAGSQPDEMKNKSWIDVGQISHLEDRGNDLQRDLSWQLSQLVGAGPGQGDVEDATGAGRSLAQMLEEMSRTGGLPSAGDISTSEGLAGSLFGRRRTALQQSFDDQSVETDRRSAMLGRSVNDPILQAKLRTGMMKETALLDADQSAFATDFAMKLPERRVGFASQRADVLGNLARQAMQNRSALLSIGSNMSANERNWRLQSGKQYSTGETGGGLKGAIGGFMAGAGIGTSIGNSFAGKPAETNPFSGFTPSAGTAAGSSYSGAEYAGAFSGIGGA